MKTVRFVGAENGAQADAGRIDWDGSGLRASDPSLEWVLSSRALLPGGGSSRPVTAAEPEAFLEALQYTYRSPYFMALPPEGGDGMKALPPEQHRFGPAQPTPLRRYSKPPGEGHPVIEPDQSRPKEEAPVHQLPEESVPAPVPADPPPQAERRHQPTPVEPPAAPKPSLKKQREAPAGESDPNRFADIETPANLPELAKVNPANARKEMGELALRYMGAINRYTIKAVTRKGKDRDTAEGVAYDFLTGLMDGTLLAEFDPAKDRFRDFLKKKLVTFINHHPFVHGERRRGNLVQEQYGGQIEENAPVKQEADPETLAMREAMREDLIQQAWKSLEEHEKGAGVLWHTIFSYKHKHPEKKYAEIAADLSGQLGRSLTEQMVRDAARKGRDKFQKYLYEAAQWSVHPGESVRELLDELDLSQYVVEQLNKELGEAKLGVKGLEGYAVKGPPAAAGTAAPKPPQLPKAPTPPTVQPSNSKQAAPPPPMPAQQTQEGPQQAPGPKIAPQARSSPAQAGSGVPGASVEHPAALPPEHRSPAEHLMLQIHGNGTDEEGIRQLEWHLASLGADELEDLHRRYEVNADYPLSHSLGRQHGHSMHRRNLILSLLHHMFGRDATDAALNGQPAPAAR